VDEVKQIRDQSEAMRLYARQAKNRDLEVDAAEIRFRAERRLGELLVAQKVLPREKGGGMAPGGQPYQKRASTCSRAEQVGTPRLAELGIDRKLSSRAQKLAAVPAPEFEENVRQWRGRVAIETERVTTNLIRAGERERAAEEARASMMDKAETTRNFKALIGRDFTTVYADPPWEYGNQGTRAATDNHYPTMTLADIGALPVSKIVARNAHLHLWTTNAFLFEARAVMEAWGFEYRSCFVWVKPQMGNGNYWRVSHEFLLFGLRGDLPFADRALMSWAAMDRTTHSQKPASVRALVERASPAPRVELFGRATVEGWTVWGNDAACRVIDVEEVG
jgi:N6-adenosine-specific RNA methylase IME4